MNTKTNGWNDLAVQSKGTWHLLKYDGTKYPGNPSVAPVMPVMPGDDLERALHYEYQPTPGFHF